MKKLILFVIAILTIQVGFSQSWTSSNRLTSTEDLFEIESTIDHLGNVFMFGYFEDTLFSSLASDIISYGGRDYFVAKFQPDGSLEWLNQIGSNLSDFVLGGIGTDSNGDIYTTGSFMGYVKYTPNDSLLSTGIFDVFLIKFNSSGNVLWGRNVGKGTNMQISTSLEIDSNDDILIAGFYNDSIEFDANNALYADNAFSHYFYAKFDGTTGDSQWGQRARPINSAQSGRFFSISTDASFYVFGGPYIDSIGFEIDTVESYNSSADIHLLKTDTDGSIEWIRNVHGDNSEYSYSTVIDDDKSIYIAGYYDSPILTIDSSDTESITLDNANANIDIFVIKYDDQGVMQWARSIGGAGKDKVFDLDFFDDRLQLSGEFSDTLFWGGIELTTNGTSDIDMFTGSIDKDGNFRTANSYGGRSNSTETSRAILKNNNDLYTVIRSDSDLLILGDSSYTSTNGTHYIVIGVIGCLPISVDNTIPTNIIGCYGDSTGSIQVVASGGFGSPWQYSIDNSDSYSDVAFYGDLPAGDYQVVVIDAENCTQIGPLITLTEPDSLEAILVSSEDIIHHTGWRDEVVVTEGSLVATATGGTSPYTYQLLPGGSPQALGTYYFPYADSGKYVVAVNDLNNCGPSNTDTVEISVVYTTGVGDFDGVETKVYPNPTSGIVNIEIPFEGKKCKMEVVNMTGQTVLKRKVFPSGGIITETLDLSDQAKGVYMLRINNQTVQSAIVVK